VSYGRKTYSDLAPDGAGTRGGPARWRPQPSRCIGGTGQGKITETELQIIQIDQELRSEVSKELREIQAKTAELVERKVAAEDQLTRVEIRAPQDGIVHQLAVHRSVVWLLPATLMLVVPEGDELTVEARALPHDIDQLRVGQKSVLRFSAFNQRTTPEINGELKRISADISQDQRTGASYYLVRVTIPLEEVARLDGLKLVPGMPGRGVHPDRSPHGDFVSRQAAAGPDCEGIS
jgi:HlyD family secretion protein